MTVEEAVAALVDSLGTNLTPEQRALGTVALRLARGMDEDAAAYAVASTARELRATLDALAGAPVAGQGVDQATWDELVARLMRGES